MSHPPKLTAIAVDISCSALVAATKAGSALLSPAVAPASVLATVDGSSLPPGGDRVECSARVDALLKSQPEQALSDPYSHIHLSRVEVAGLSVPRSELMLAPLHRAVSWAGAGASAAGLILVVPSRWGPIRTTLMGDAARATGRTVRTVRSALLVAEALPASATRWAMCVEACDLMSTVTLIRRADSELRTIGSTVVYRVDPNREMVDDDEVPRVIAAIRSLRRAHREAASGSFEVLARGRNAAAVVDACDAARILSFRVPEVGPAEAAIRLLGRR